MIDAKRQKLRELAKRAPAGPYKLWTSNSFRRISSERGGDGDVLCAIVQRTDRQPDLHGAPGVLDYFVAVDPTTVLELLDEIEELKAYPALADDVQRLLTAWDSATSTHGIPHSTDQLLTKTTMEVLDIGRLRSEIVIMERTCNHCGHVDRHTRRTETEHCGGCGVEANPIQRRVDPQTPDLRAKIAATIEKQLWQESVDTFKSISGRVVAAVSDMLGIAPVGDVPSPTPPTAEQQARNMLDRMGVPDVQSYSSGDLVELANLIARSAP